MGDGRSEIRDGRSKARDKGGAMGGTDERCEMRNERWEIGHGGYDERWEIGHGR